MSITLKNLSHQVEHAAGDQTGARVVPEDVVNEAGEFLCTMHPWPWLDRPSTLLTPVDGQDWIDLPDDFAKLIGVESADRITTRIHLTSRAKVDQLRGIINGTTTDWFVAIEYPGQENRREGPGRARLSVYAGNNLAESPSIRLHYRAKWRVLVRPEDVANVPDEMIPLLKRCVRAVSLGYTRESEGTVDERLSAVAESAMARLMFEHYGTVQPIVGQMRGGMCAPPRSDRGSHYLHNTLTINQN